MSAGTDTASIAVLMSPAPSLVSVNLVSSWQETTDLALVSDAPLQLTLNSDVAHSTARIR